MIPTKSSYCPNCFNMCLELKSSGKVNLYFDGKKKESSVFIYNLHSNLPEDIQQKVLDKLVDFFQWYGSFGNKQPISKVEALSSDFICEDGCSLNPSFQPSVVGILFDQKFFENAVQEIAEKYGVEID